MKIRLQKIISQNSIYSRRKSENLIIEKRVKVNGIIAIPGTKVDPNHDKIIIDSNLLQIKNRKIKVIAFNKPIGIISSMSGADSLEPYAKKYSDKLFHIGRLDKDSHGLIFLSNDGNFAQEISHPKNNIIKKYIVNINFRITNKIITKLKKGFYIKDKAHDFIKFDNVKILQITPKKTIIEVTLHSGKNRIIKRAFKEFNIAVLDLLRIQIGSIKLNELKNGHLRVLSDSEIKSLRKNNQLK